MDFFFKIYDTTRTNKENENERKLFCGQQVDGTPHQHFKWTLQFEQLAKDKANHLSWKQYELKRTTAKNALSNSFWRPNDIQETVSCLHGKYLINLFAHPKL